MRVPDVILRSQDNSTYDEPAYSFEFMNEMNWRIIVIHGFRNSERDAMATYQRFYSELLECHSFFQNKVFFLVWPGDSLGWDVTRYFDDNVQNSLNAGIALAEGLNRVIARDTAHNVRCAYVIVAHSLGCRLTAQMMQHLHSLNPAACKLFKLFLMAGAVPKDDVQNPNVFATGLSAAEYRANLYSPEDGTLRRLFRLGELGGGRWPSEAIGLNGEPAQFGWSVRERMPNFKHEDYWKDSRVARFLARSLGLPIETELPEIALSSFVPPSHELT
jgi:Alpha/beta hydrolase of unknown function (DUF900)